MDFRRHKELPLVHPRISEDMEPLNVFNSRHLGTSIAPARYWHSCFWRTAAGSTESIVLFERAMDFLRCLPGSCGNSHMLFRFSTTRPGRLQRCGRPVYP